MRLFREQACVYATEDRDSSMTSHQAPQFIASAGIAGMDADSDDVAGVDSFCAKRLDRFIDDDRIAERPGSRPGKNIKPAGRDYADTETYVTRTYQIYLQGIFRSLILR